MKNFNAENIVFDKFSLLKLIFIIKTLPIEVQIVHNL